MMLDFTKAYVSTDNLLLNKYGDRFLFELLLQEPLGKKAYKSVLRDDNIDPDDNPSLSFYNITDPLRKGITIAFKDWGKAYSGNIFKFAKIYFEVRDKKEYSYDEVYLKLYDLSLLSKIDKDIVKTVQLKQRNFGYNIETALRPVDFKYWLHYGITIKTLHKFNVAKVNTVYDVDTFQPLFRSTDKNPTYVYRNLGESNKSFQLYRPLSLVKDNKFHNSFVKDDNVCFGYNQLPNNGDILFITKSMKDVMTLYELGYSAIGVTSESANINSFYIQDCKNRFSKVILLFDNDETGVNRSMQLSKQHNLINIFIPAINNAVKDISDLYKFDKNVAKGFLKGRIEVHSN